MANLFIGIAFGISIGMWLSRKLMNAYMDKSIEMIFPNQTTVIVPDPEKNCEVPALMEAIENIKVNQQLN